MTLYQIIRIHNRPWSALEICFFLIFYSGILLVTLLMFQRKKIVFSQMIAVLLLVLYLAVVFESTVFTRIPGERKYELEVFWSWKRICRHGSEMLLQENLLNMVLLFPVGLLLPVVWKRTEISIRKQMVGIRKKVKHSGSMEVLVGLIVGLLISSAIELLQLVLCRGLFEWDDMIHNSLGCAVGVAAMKWILKWRCGIDTTKMKNTHQNEKHRHWKKWRSALSKNFL